MQNNMPELNHPIISLMNGNATGVPALVNKLFPSTKNKVTPQDFALTLPLKVWKIKKVADYAENEERAARANYGTIKAVQDGMHDYVTSSARIADSLGEYEHRKTMRALEVQEKQAQIYLLQAQANTAGYEAKQSELDYDVKLKQMKEMLNGSPKA